MLHRLCVLISQRSLAQSPLNVDVPAVVVIYANITKTPDFRTTLGELRTEVDALVISVLQHLPDTVAGFDRFSKNASAAAASQHRAQVLPENTKFTAGPSSRSRGVPVHTVGASLNSTIARGVPRKRPEVEESVSTAGVGVTLVQEMLEPELAGLRPRQCSGPLAQVRKSWRYKDTVLFAVMFQSTRTSHCLSM